METDRALYRDQDNRWLLNPDPTNPDVAMFHPDDSLDGKTTLHIFPSQARATEFIEDLEEECNQGELNVSWTEPDQFQDEELWGVVVEEHEEMHPERLRGVIEITHK
jgi:ribosomal protein L11 methylase PrmA